MKQIQPTCAAAASLLGMVKNALALEQAGATVLVWPETPLGPLWSEVVQGKFRKLHWGKPEGYVVPTLTADEQALWEMLDGYFSGTLAQPVWECFAPEGTAFQKKVWRALCDIPWGETVTYGELAARVGSHARAVGGAVGSNPVPILIPCHRVMGKDGSLTGFSAPGGLVTKTWLLKHEGVL